MPQSASILRSNTYVHHFHSLWRCYRKMGLQRLLLKRLSRFKELFVVRPAQLNSGQQRQLQNSAALGIDCSSTYLYD